MKTQRLAPAALVLLLTLLILNTSSDVLRAELTQQQEAQLREKAKNRPRRLIFNDDGNAPVYLCTTPDPQQLLSKRTTPLLNTQVDSIFFCSMFGSFGLFTHDTKVGYVFDVKQGVDDSGVNRLANNVAREFIESGNDALKIVTTYCREHDKEIFWSLRMNDTHDASGSWYGKVFFNANPLKKEHPDWLIGSSNQQPRYGRWTAADFQRQEIRDLVFRYTEEVCENYDIDGVELDFFRHPVFFKKPANGVACDQSDRDLMTNLVARIHRMTQAEGRRRGRPILLAVRVPDSVEYCRAIGLDLEKWLQEGYVDLLIPSGYFKLNPWPYSVELGHKYGAKVYPSLDESRVREAAAQRKRRSTEAYLGRAANIWASGADGVYLFNYSGLFDLERRVESNGNQRRFDSQADILNGMGSVETLSGADKTYFASVRGLASAAGGNFPYGKFLHVSTLNPAQPIRLSVDKVSRVSLFCGEDFTSVSSEPKVTLTIRLNGANASDELVAKLNGETLQPTATEGVNRIYSLKPAQLLRGPNQLEVMLHGEDKPNVLWTDAYVDVDYE